MKLDSDDLLNVSQFIKMLELAIAQTKLDIASGIGLYDDGELLGWIDTEKGTDRLVFTQDR